MSSACRKAGRLWCYPAACLVAASVAAPSFADSPRVLRIEEHWELRVAQPDSERSAPQVTMVVAPEDGLEGIHFLFTLNHSNAPDYIPGGMQVQAWDGSFLIESNFAEECGALNQPGEVVTWIQRLSLEEGMLTFQVSDGNSETWGPFGGSDLSLDVPTSLASLNEYRPGVSLSESQVSYAENRVEALTLKKLVWITEDGAVHELNAPIAVDTSLDP